MKFSTSLTISLALLVGCTSGDITERPERRPQSSSISPLESHIALSAQIDLQKAQSRLNDLIPDPSKPIVSFHGDQSGCIKKKIKPFGPTISIGCKWNGEVYKKGSATIAGAAQGLNFIIPVKAWARVKNKGFVRVTETFQVDLTVTATASPKLRSDWSLDLNLSTDFKWDKRPRILLLGFIPIRISGLVEPKIWEQLKKVEEQIKTEIRSLDIRGRAMQAWEKAHAPIKLSSDPEVWLRFKPKAIRFSGIHTQNSILAASVSMAANMETILGERPDAFPVSPLPELGEQDRESGPFHIRLPIILEYEALKKEIEKVLRVRQKWAPIQKKPSHYVTVQEVEVYPSKENIVVGINFSADLPDEWLDTRGKVYFQGKPVIDNEQRMMKVENFDFTRTTDNALINVVSLLFRERIKSELSSALTYRFGDEYDKFINAANVELNRDFGDGVTSQGFLDYAKVDKVVMFERGIYLSVISTGQLQFNFGL